MSMLTDKLAAMIAAVEQLKPATPREIRLHPDDYDALRAQARVQDWRGEAGDLLRGLPVVVDEKAERLPLRLAPTIDP